MHLAAAPALELAGGRLEPCWIRPTPSSSCTTFRTSPSRKRVHPVPDDRLALLNTVQLDYPRHWNVVRRCAWVGDDPLPSTATTPAGAP